ncbi:hypothetical protein RRG08_027181 [Elysia crispata]|uniref:L-Fucosyltransferase n=1 Tax=Elysia crispata TaxID=231223 RepID=A0AAE1DXL5_9GAST|nr:hypothetical protein RRG08_027181 [Elysia crispata]
MNLTSLTHRRVFAAAILACTVLWILKTYDSEYKISEDGLHLPSTGFQERSISPCTDLSKDELQTMLKSSATPTPSCPSSSNKRILTPKKELEKLCGWAILPCGYSPSNASMRYLLVTPRGRLGNQMFQLASSLGIASQHGMAVCLSPKVPFLDYFKLRGAEKIKWTKTITWLRVSERSWASFDPCLLRVPHDNIHLSEYLQSYRYFHHIWETVRQHFTFNDTILSEAREILDSVWHKESYPRGETAVVGVHVRRNDMLFKHNKAWGHVVATRAYFFKAMRWMIGSMPNKTVLFLVVSDDIAWCERFLSGSYVRVAPPASASVHLALLASCDHVIMSTGTFGWWGAWMAGGKVVYYKNYPAENSPLAKGFNRTDFFLPSWVALD